MDSSINKGSKPTLVDDEDDLGLPHDRNNGSAGQSEELTIVIEKALKGMLESSRIVSQNVTANYLDFEGVEQDECDGAGFESNREDVHKACSSSKSVGVGHNVHFDSDHALYGYAVATAEEIGLGNEIVEVSANDSDSSLRKDYIDNNESFIIDSDALGSEDVSAEEVLDELENREHFEHPPTSSFNCDKKSGYGIPYTNSSRDDSVEEYHSSEKSSVIQEYKEENVAVKLTKNSIISNVLNKVVTVPKLVVYKRNPTQASNRSASDSLKFFYESIAPNLADEDKNESIDVEESSRFSSSENNSFEEPRMPLLVNETEMEANTCSEDRPPPELTPENIPVTEQVIGVVHPFNHEKSFNVQQQTDGLEVPSLTNSRKPLNPPTDVITKNRFRSQCLDSVTNVSRSMIKKHDVSKTKAIPSIVNGFSDKCDSMKHEYISNEVNIRQGISSGSHYRVTHKGVKPVSCEDPKEINILNDCSLEPRLPLTIQNHSVKVPEKLKFPLNAYDYNDDTRVNIAAKPNDNHSEFITKGQQIGVINRRKKTNVVEGNRKIVKSNAHYTNVCNVQDEITPMNERKKSLRENSANNMTALPSMPILMSPTREELCSLTPDVQNNNIKRSKGEASKESENQDIVKKQKPSRSTATQLRSFQRLSFNELSQSLSNPNTKNSLKQEKNSKQDGYLVNKSLVNNMKSKENSIAVVKQEVFNDHKTIGIDGYEHNIDIDLNIRVTRSSSRKKEYLEEIAKPIIKGAPNKKLINNFVKNHVHTSDSISLPLETLVIEAKETESSFKSFDNLLTDLELDKTQTSSLDETVHSLDPFVKDIESTPDILEVLPGADILDGGIPDKEIIISSADVGIIKNDILEVNVPCLEDGTFSTILNFFDKDLSSERTDQIQQNECIENPEQFFNKNDFPLTIPKTDLVFEVDKADFITDQNVSVLDTPKVVPIELNKTLSNVGDELISNISKSSIDGCPDKNIITNNCDENNSEENSYVSFRNKSFPFAKPTDQKDCDHKNSLYSDIEKIDQVLDRELADSLGDMNLDNSSQAISSNSGDNQIPKEKILTEVNCEKNVVEANILNEDTKLLAGSSEPTAGCIGYQPRNNNKFDEQIGSSNSEDIVDEKSLSKEEKPTETVILEQQNELGNNITGMNSKMSGKREQISNKMAKEENSNNISSHIDSSDYLEDISDGDFEVDEGSDNDKKPVKNKSFKGNNGLKNYKHSPNSIISSRKSMGIAPSSSQKCVYQKICIRREVHKLPSGSNIRFPKGCLSFNMPSSTNRKQRVYDSTDPRGPFIRMHRKKGRTRSRISKRQKQNKLKLLSNNTVSSSNVYSTLLKGKTVSGSGTVKKSDSNNQFGGNSSVVNNISSASDEKGSISKVSILPPQNDVSESAWQRKKNLPHIVQDKETSSNVKNEIVPHLVKNTKSLMNHLSENSINSFKPNASRSNIADDCLIVGKLTVTEKIKYYIEKNETPLKKKLSSLDHEINCPVNSDINGSQSNTTAEVSDKKQKMAPFQVLVEINNVESFNNSYSQAHVESPTDHIDLPIEINKSSKGNFEGAKKSNGIQDSIGGNTETAKKSNGIQDSIGGNTETAKKSNDSQDSIGGNTETAKKSNGIQDSIGGNTETVITLNKPLMEVQKNIKTSLINENDIASKGTISPGLELDCTTEVVVCSQQKIIPDASTLKKGIVSNNISAENDVITKGNCKEMPNLSNETPETVSCDKLLGVDKMISDSCGSVILSVEISNVEGNQSVWNSIKENDSNKDQQLPKSPQRRKRLEPKDKKAGLEDIIKKLTLKSEMHVSDEETHKKYFENKPTDPVSLNSSEKESGVGNEVVRCEHSMEMVLDSESPKIETEIITDNLDAQMEMESCFVKCERTNTFEGLCTAAVVSENRSSQSFLNNDMNFLEQKMANGEVFGKIPSEAMGIADSDPEQICHINESVATMEVSIVSSDSPSQIDEVIPLNNNEHSLKSLQLNAEVCVDDKKAILHLTLSNENLNSASPEPTSTVSRGDFFTKTLCQTDRHSPDGLEHCEVSETLKKTAPSNENYGVNGNFNGFVSNSVETARKHVNESAIGPHYTAGKEGIHQVKSLSADENYSPKNMEECGSEPVTCEMKLVTICEKVPDKTSLKDTYKSCQKDIKNQTNESLVESKVYSSEASKMGKSKFEESDKIDAKIINILVSEIDSFDSEKVACTAADQQLNLTPTVDTDLIADIAEKKSLLKTSGRIIEKYESSFETTDHFENVTFIKSDEESKPDTDISALPEDSEPNASERDTEPLSDSLARSVSDNHNVMTETQNLSYLVIEPVNIVNRSVEIERTTNGPVSNDIKDCGKLLNIDSNVAENLSIENHIVSEIIDKQSLLLDSAFTDKATKEKNLERITAITESVMSEDRPFDESLVETENTDYTLDACEKNRVKEDNHIKISDKKSSDMNPTIFESTSGIKQLESVKINSSSYDVQDRIEKPVNVNTLYSESGNNSKEFCENLVANSVSKSLGLSKNIENAFDIDTKLTRVNTKFCVTGKSNDIEPPEAVIEKSYEPSVTENMIVKDTSKTEITSNSFQVVDDDGGIRNKEIGVVNMDHCEDMVQNVMVEQAIVVRTFKGSLGGKPGEIFQPEDSVNRGVTIDSGIGHKHKIHEENSCISIENSNHVADIETKSTKDAFSVSYLPAETHEEFGDRSFNPLIVLSEQEKFDEPLHVEKVDEVESHIIHEHLNASTSTVNSGNLVNNTEARCSAVSNLHLEIDEKTVRNGTANLVECAKSKLIKNNEQNGLGKLIIKKFADSQGDNEKIDVKSSAGMPLINKEIKSASRLNNLTDANEGQSKDSSEIYEPREIKSQGCNQYIDSEDMGNECENLNYNIQIKERESKIESKYAASFDHKSTCLNNEIRSIEKETGKMCDALKSQDKNSEKIQEPNHFQNLMQKKSREVDMISEDMSSSKASEHPGKIDDFQVEVNYKRKENAVSCDTKSSDVIDPDEITNNDGERCKVSNDLLQSQEQILEKNESVNYADENSNKEKHMECENEVDVDSEEMPSLEDSKHYDKIDDSQIEIKNKRNTNEVSCDSKPSDPSDPLPFRYQDLETIDEVKDVESSFKEKGKEDEVEVHMHSEDMPLLEASEHSYKIDNSQVEVYNEEGNENVSCDSKSNEISNNDEEGVEVSSDLSMSQAQNLKENEELKDAENSFKEKQIKGKKEVGMDSEDTSSLKASGHSDKNGDSQVEVNKKEKHENDVCSDSKSDEISNMDEEGGEVLSDLSQSQAQNLKENEELKDAENSFKEKHIKGEEVVDVDSEDTSSLRASGHSDKIDDSQVEVNKEEERRENDVDSDSKSNEISNMDDEGGELSSGLLQSQEQNLKENEELKEAENSFKEKHIKGEEVDDVDSEDTSSLRASEHSGKIDYSQVEVDKEERRESEVSCDSKSDEISDMVEEGEVSGDLLQSEAQNLEENEEVNFAENSIKDKHIDYDKDVNTNQGITDVEIEGAERSTSLKTSEDAINIEYTMGTDQLVNEIIVESEIYNSDSESGGGGEIDKQESYFTPCLETAEVNANGEPELTVELSPDFEETPDSQSIIAPIDSVANSSGNIFKTDVEPGEGYILTACLINEEPKEKLKADLITCEQSSNSKIIDESTFESNVGNVNDTLKEKISVNDEPSLTTSESCDESIEEDDRKVENTLSLDHVRREDAIINRNRSIDYGVYSSEQSNNKSALLDNVTSTSLVSIPVFSSSTNSVSSSNEVISHTPPPSPDVSLYDYSSESTLSVVDNENSTDLEQPNNCGHPASDGYDLHRNANVIVANCFESSDLMGSTEATFSVYKKTKLDKVVTDERIGVYHSKVNSDTLKPKVLGQKMQETRSKKQHANQSSTLGHEGEPGSSKLSYNKMDFMRCHNLMATKSQPKRRDGEEGKKDNKINFIQGEAQSKIHSNLSYIESSPKYNHTPAQEEILLRLVSQYTDSPRKQFISTNQLEETPSRRTSDLVESDENIIARTQRSLQRFKFPEKLKEDETSSKNISSVQNFSSSSKSVFNDAMKTNNSKSSALPVTFQELEEKFMLKEVKVVLKKIDVNSQTSCLKLNTNVESKINKNSRQIFGCSGAIKRSSFLGDQGEPPRKILHVHSPKLIVEDKFVVMNESKIRNTKSGNSKSAETSKSLTDTSMKINNTSVPKVVEMDGKIRENLNQCDVLLPRLDSFADIHRCMHKNNIKRVFVPENIYNFFKKGDLTSMYSNLEIICSRSLERKTRFKRRRRKSSSGTDDEFENEDHLSKNRPTRPRRHLPKNTRHSKRFKSNQSYKEVDSSEEQVPLRHNGKQEQSSRLTDSHRPGKREMVFWTRRPVGRKRRFCRSECHSEVLPKRANLGVDSSQACSQDPETMKHPTAKETILANKSPLNISTSEGSNRQGGMLIGGFGISNYSSRLAGIFNGCSEDLRQLLHGVIRNRAIQAQMTSEDEEDSDDDFLGFEDENKCGCRLENDSMPSRCQDKCFISRIQIKRRYLNRTLRLFPSSSRCEVQGSDSEMSRCDEVSYVNRTSDMFSDSNSSVGQGSHSNWTVVPASSSIGGQLSGSEPVNLCSETLQQSGNRRFRNFRLSGDKSEERDNCRSGKNLELHHQESEKPFCDPGICFVSLAVRNATVVKTEEQERFLSSQDSFSGHSQLVSAKSVEVEKRCQTPLPQAPSTKQSSSSLDPKEDERCEDNSQSS